jgi:predicted N-formylglutamate amidohydrolase
MPARQPSIPYQGLKPDAHAAGVPLGVRNGGSFYLVTCEHGGKRVPPAFRAYFEGREPLLESHRGHDPGALILGREIADALHAPFIAATTSRLLVDLNRSPSNPSRYSEITRELPDTLLHQIHVRYYQPYRRRIERLVAAAIRHGARVVHISSHSFTPVMDGHVRNADLGFLYDPARPGEVALARHWMSCLERREPSLRLRRNYPYAGRSDGFCTWLRRHYGPEAYLGLELEVNQRHPREGGPYWPQLRQEIAQALLSALGDTHRRSVRSRTPPPASARESGPAGPAIRP